MNVNEETMHRFYSAFQRRDAVAMNSCYAAEVIFYDPVFEDLVNDEVRGMWEMLLKRADDLQIVFDRVEADDEYGTCHWQATYTFSATRRKIVNKIKAHMRFREGKIIEHSDQFNLYDWSKQAFGITGWLFGWSSFFQRRIRKAAQGRLYQYLTKNTESAKFTD